MIIGLLVCLSMVRAAQPLPSTLVAAWVNSFLNLSKLPYSFSMASARVPPGFPPPLPAGARLVQYVEWRRCPPMLNESSLRVDFMSMSVFSLRALSSFWKMLFAPVTYAW